MRLYDFALAPNPRRVRMLLAEKSVEIPLVEVNTREREQFEESFMAVNSLSMVPVLELDDGTCIAESVAICRYIEELHPEPPLMGTDAKDRAEAFSIADISAFVTIEFAKRAEVELPGRGTENVVRWHGEIAARPSATA